jgi:hypothetical protein
MERHLLAALCFAVLATTAGCSGFLGDGVPTTEEPTETEAAPGVPAVDSDGETVTVDTDRLLAANDRIRANTSYTIDRTVTVSSRDGTGSLTVGRTLQVTPNGTLERLTVDQREPFTLVLKNGTRWTDDNGTWTRTLLANNRTTTGKRLPGELEPYGYGEDLLEAVLATDSYRVRDREEGVLVRPRSLDVDGGRLSSLSTDAPTNQRAEIFVDRVGLVRSLTLRYDTVYRTEQVSITIRHELVDVGETTVERPDWIPTDNRDQ